MKYTITILLEIGIYQEIEVSVPIDCHESWDTFLAHEVVKKVLSQEPTHTVIDIDPHIDFKNPVLQEQPIANEIEE